MTLEDAKVEERTVFKDTAWSTKGVFELEGWSRKA